MERNKKLYENENGEGFWQEIKCDYLDEQEGYWTVDAWKTLEESEEGKVIAVIDAATAKVYCIDKLALYDTYAQEVINRKRAEILNG